MGSGSCCWRGREPVSSHRIWRRVESRQGCAAIARQEINITGRIVWAERLVRSPRHVIGRIQLKVQVMSVAKVGAGPWRVPVKWMGNDGFSPECWIWCERRLNVADLGWSEKLFAVNMESLFFWARKVNKLRQQSKIFFPSSCRK